MVGETANGAEQFAIDVKLALVPGTVADPNGGGVSFLNIRVKDIEAVYAGWRVSYPACGGVCGR